MEVSEAQMLADDVHKGLGAPLRLHREAALQKLDKRLQDGSAADQQAFLEAMCSRVLQLLPSEVWQHRLGGFDAAKVCLPLTQHGHAAARRSWQCHIDTRSTAAERHDLTIAGARPGTATFLCFPAKLPGRVPGPS